jgi:formamidopyrimidine-DNA glycosylase
MPELPEVEIHARNLRRWLLGRRISGFEVHDPLLVEGQETDHWAAALHERTVLGVTRRAKYLLLQLDGEHTLLAHLRMTGRFLHDGYVAGDLPRFTRFTLRLEGGDQVRFEDRRRFGRIRVVPTETVPQLAELVDLGPDALLEPLSVEALGLLTRGKRSIKALLMDQKAIGGIGNICAAEILYRAGIPPDTMCRELSPEQLATLAQLIPEFLEWAIEAQSRRELIYIGEKGAENVFSIYRRAGTPCPRCETPIVRTVVAGRGTYSCPTCQPSTPSAGSG